MVGDHKGVAALIQLVREKLSSPRSLEMRFSVYGKLPFYKDFLRSSLAAREAQAFKQWLDRGISHYWGMNEPYRSQTIPPHGLLLAFPGTGRQVLACLWGSHDEGLLRFFPFTIFISLPAAREPLPRLASLDLLAQLMTFGRRMRDELAGIQSVESFYSWARGGTIELTLRPEIHLEKELGELLSDYTAGQLAEELYGDRAESCWPALLAYLRRHQEQARSKGGAVSLAVRLPEVGTGRINRLPLIRQAQLWCSFLRLRTSRTDEPASLLVPALPGAGITILQRRLRPDDIYALHHDITGYEQLEDLRTGVPRPAGPDEEPPEPVDRSISLATLVGLPDPGKAGQRRQA